MKSQDKEAVVRLDVWKPELLSHSEKSYPERAAGSITVKDSPQN